MRGPGVRQGLWSGEGGVGAAARFGSQARPRCLQPPVGLTGPRAGGWPEQRSAAADALSRPQGRCDGTSRVAGVVSLVAVHPSTVNSLGKQLLPKTFGQSNVNISQQVVRPGGLPSEATASGAGPVPGVPGAGLPARGFPAAPASALVGPVGGACPWVGRLLLAGAGCLPGTRGRHRTSLSWDRGSADAGRGCSGLPGWWEGSDSRGLARCPPGAPPAPACRLDGLFLMQPVAMRGGAFVSHPCLWPGPPAGV